MKQKIHGGIDDLCRIFLNLDVSSTKPWYLIIHQQVIYSILRMLSLCPHGLAIHTIQSWVILLPSSRIWQPWTMSLWSWIAILMPVCQYGKIEQSQTFPFTLYLYCHSLFRCIHSSFSCFPFFPFHLFHQHSSFSFSIPFVISCCLLLCGHSSH